MTIRKRTVEEIEQLFADIGLDKLYHFGAYHLASLYTKYSEYENNGLTKEVVTKAIVNNFAISPNQRIFSFVGKNSEVIRYSITDFNLYCYLKKHYEDISLTLELLDDLPNKCEVLEVIKKTKI